MDTCEGTKRGRVKRRWEKEQEAAKVHGGAVRKRTICETLQGSILGSDFKLNFQCGLMKSFVKWNRRHGGNINEMKFDELVKCEIH